MSIPISQFTPPLPSWCSCLFSMSASLFLFCKWDHLYHFSRFCIHESIYDICFSLPDLLLLCMTVSRFIHVSTNKPILFLLRLNSISLYIYMYHSSFNSLFHYSELPPHHPIDFYYFCLISLHHSPGGQEKKRRQLWHLPRGQRSP